jgi:signal transduction histidine kinase
MVLQGPDKGLRFRVTDGEAALLGRSSAAMALTDYTVSRRHAELKPSPSGRGWVLEDLKSANGTYLNGRRLERPTRLKHGDQIKMGGTLMIWDGSDEKSLESGPGTAIVADLVNLEATGDRVDASIIGSVGAGDDSMILATPAAAEAVRSWRVMSALLDAVGAIMSPRQLVERVMDLLFEEVPASRGFILMKDPAAGKFEIEAVRWSDDSRDRILASRAIVDHVIEHREGVLCTNAMSDDRFKARAGPGGAEIGLQSVICVPLIAREDVLGVIYLDCPMARHIYTDEQLRLAAAIGQMAGLAIEDARLVNERMRTERLAAAGETVAALSHYIKNILQGLTGGSDVVEMGLRAQSLATVDQGWQVVQRNFDKIYSLTMNMLAYAKQREPRLGPVQLNVLVEDVLRLVARRAEDKGVLVKSQLAPSLPAVPLDENGIHQVVLNIVANAIDAAPKGTGVVNVSTAFDPAADAAVVAIGDNGTGIPPDVQQRIFDPFYSTKGHGGTGLGLAVARKIVDEHMGRIAVASVPGEGTVIRVILPIQAKRGVDSAATDGPPR